MNIRLAKIEDAQAILDIYRPYVLNTNITFEYEVPSIDEFKSRIEQTLKKYPYLVAVEKNKIVGYAYAGSYKNRAAYDWGCELSIYVDENYHHQGIGKKLYDKLIQLLKEMNYQILYACITYPNDKSIAFHKQYGFKQIAYFEKCGYKFNQWADMVWLEKRIADAGDVKKIKNINEVKVSL